MSYNNNNNQTNSNQNDSKNDNYDFTVSSKRLLRDKETYYDDGSDRAFRDYKSSQDTRPYPVYRNDIKFKNLRNINPSRAVWDDDVKNDYYNKNTDFIDYRIEECIREKSEMIDISHMDSDCFVLLLSHKLFPKIKDKIQHIFAKDCNLKKVPNLDCFTSLLTLDLSCNKISSLPKLPETLEELIINDNRISEITHELPNLLRFNGADNVINKFNYPKNIERIHLKNNPITYIVKLDKLYFLDISTTKITKLYPLQNLKYLDMTFTNIDILPEMYSLQILLCNDSYLTDITALKDLNTIDMIRTKIKYIPYFKSLQKIVYEKGAVFGISNQYKGKLKHIKQNKNDIIETSFVQN